MIKYILPNRIKIDFKRPVLKTVFHTASHRLFSFQQRHAGPLVQWRRVEERVAHRPGVADTERSASLGLEGGQPRRPAVRDPGQETHQELDP